MVARNSSRCHSSMLCHRTRSVRARTCWLPYALARARAAPPDAPPHRATIHDPFARDVLPPTACPTVHRCPPHHATIHDPRSARTRETPPNVLPILPALRTRARAPCRGARPVSLANVDARLRRAGFFIGCSEIKKKILKPPPTFVLRRCSPHPPF